MKELKTLKDLAVPFFMENGFKKRCVPEETLKAEAIKWVKEKDKIEMSDWIEFFGIEEDVAELCFKK